MKDFRKTKNSLWKESVSLPSFPMLEGDRNVDVLIIGGGIAGLLTAYLLHQEGVQYLLLEQSSIASGTTGYTTAKITFQHGLVYHKILKRYGEESALRYLNANRSAFSRLTKLCQKTDCDLEVRDNYVYSANDQRILEKEMEALGRIDCKARYHKSIDLPLPTAGAIAFPEQAQFHPLKFLAAIAKDLHICENSRVTELAENTAKTEHGTVKAKKIIVTTHFPFINKHGSYFLKLFQHRSYVIALKNAKIPDGMFVDEAQTGLSFRNYKEYLLLGGGGHRTGKRGGGWSELHAFCQDRYPNAEIRYQWATQDCMSLDSMPYIGAYSKKTHGLLVASGFNKWGMTGAMLSAILLCDDVLQKENRYQALFLPSRNILTAQLARNAGEAILGLITPSVKRCPHLGCALKWNKAEHTWDCSCHGSRFDEHGHVLNNPANHDLNQK